MLHSLAGKEVLRKKNYGKWLFQRLSNQRESLFNTSEAYLEPGETSVRDVLRDLVPFIQFKKREKHPWRIVTFSKALARNFTKSNTLPWVFFTFLKLYKWYQITQRITYDGAFL